jgi:hypothetical protein
MEEEKGTSGVAKFSVYFLLKITTERPLFLG